MSGPEDLLRHLPNDIGGLPTGPVQRVEHKIELWEKRCHAPAEVLNLCKIINTEEKRRRVEALGTDMVGRLSYYERWIAASANIPYQKDILTPGELARKMEELKERDGDAR